MILRLALLLPLMAAALAGPGAAHGTHHDAPPPKAASAAEVTIKLPEVRLVDSTGAPRLLGKEVIGSRLAIVDFIYTSCTSVCPVLTSVLGLVQDQLGDRLGTEVAMVSVSIDPATDTPARMKDYAARFGARPEWAFLTGAKPEIDRLLAHAGVHAPNPADHTPVVLVGDPARNAWVRLYGMPSPEQIRAALDGVAQGRGGVPLGVAARDGHKHGRGEEVRHGTH